MRTRRALDHDAALSRRLGQLGDELSAHPGGVRPARPQPPPSDLTTASWWDDHTRPAAPWGAPPPPPAAPGRPPPPPPLLPRPSPAPRARPPGRHAAPRQHIPG